MKFEAQVVDQLSRNLVGVGDSVGKTTIERAALAGGRIVAADAKIRAIQQDIRQTGRGIESIAPRIVESDNYKAITMIGPSREAWYMLFQEIGTSGFPARPFLRPALDQNLARALKAMSSSYWDEIKSAARRAR